jgi:hypothetical protein
MGSPARRRKDRLARRRRLDQAVARVLASEWRALHLAAKDIVRPEYVPTDLKDVTPRKMLRGPT